MGLAVLVSTESWAGRLGCRGFKGDGGRRALVLVVVLAVRCCVVRVVVVDAGVIVVNVGDAAGEC